MREILLFLAANESSKKLFRIRKRVFSQAHHQIERIISVQLGIDRFSLSACQTFKRTIALTLTSQHAIQVSSYTMHRLQLTGHGLR